jgi:ubiquinone/menaquinone biosynthesis C-methylase UbiE
MAEPWNLTPTEWSKVLDTNADAQKLAERLSKGQYVPWNEVIQEHSKDSMTTLDLGSGRGENSAMLALQGKTATLFDWAEDNLDFSRRLFSALGKSGTFIRGDITKRLPFSDSSYDTVFSCGVLEYFTDEQIKSILKEMFRVAKKRVIILVPNAYSVCYRLGMWYMQKTNRWPWGGERAFKTLRHCFAAVPGIKVTEFSVGTRHSVVFLDALPLGSLMRRVIRKIFNLKDHAKPSTLNQGYILITIGEKK